MTVVNDAAKEIAIGKKRWTDGLTGYHYLVLVVACLGWMFDTMDQWLYVQAKTPALAELLRLAGDDAITKGWVGYAQTWFIIGWATGGLFFGMVGDRLGRTRTMAITILIYAGFTGLSGLSQTATQFTVLRFLTGLGIGGEFAAGAALVAETFPAHARTAALGLMQALSALGNVMAGVIYFLVGANQNWGWRWVFAVGLLPALLLLAIRLFVHEPDAWKKSRDEARSGGRQLGSILHLFQDRTLRRNTLVGLALAAVGVVGFWGIGTWSAELMREVLYKYTPDMTAQAVERRVSIGIMLQNGGGFFGVLAFAWFAQRLGRRSAFMMALIGCALLVPGCFYFTTSFSMALITYPVMGFILLTLFGGYAIYFPELFPTRLRATGTGFCYNVARYLSAAAPMLFGALSGQFKGEMWKAASIMSIVFVIGLVVVLPFAPETKGKPLPE
ncbi:MAG TPA: MFS transporter [Candidatus Bathyarchaeia archaeon]|nr:MFS transporter [Candidatus Bathyarchaeia archaeon]